jgi:hypothetical protein
VKRAACLVLASVLGFGCQTAAPRIERIAVDDSRVDALIAAQTRRADERQALRAALRVALDAPDLRFRRPERIAARRPSHIRVEVLGLFGQIAAVLVSDGVQYQQLAAKDNAFEAGPVSADLLWRVARIRLTPVEAVDLLLGAPLPSPGYARGGAYALSDGGVAIEYTDPGPESRMHEQVRERFEFDGAGLLRGLTHWYENGELAWLADFDDYREVSGTPFAFEVALEFPGVGARAQLSFDDVAFESDLDESLFVLRKTGKLGGSGAVRAQ